MLLILIDWTKVKSKPPGRLSRKLSQSHWATDEASLITLYPPMLSLFKINNEYFLVSANIPISNISQFYCMAMESLMINTTLLTLVLALLFILMKHSIELILHVAPMNYSVPTKGLFHLSLFPHCKKVVIWNDTRNTFRRDD